jgi:lysyl-tRNA synthetase class 2
VRVPGLRAALARLRAGAQKVPVRGRLSRGSEGDRLGDRSGDTALGEIVLRRGAPRLGDGDLVEGTLSGDPAQPALRVERVLARRRGPPASVDRDLPERLIRLEARSRVLAAIRRCLEERGFTEVETPCRVVCPGMEPHLVAFAAPPDRYLATSPELHLKRLLAAGMDRIYEITPAFRDDEGGPWHMTEFTMLEWYRAHEGLDAIVADVEALLRAAAEAGGRGHRPRGCDLTRPAERLTVREAFVRYADLDLATVRGRDALAAAVRERGVETPDDEDWDDLFSRLMLHRVEPHLGRERITILEEYPSSQAALARVREDPEWPVALRLEVYAGGLELGNAFDELTDPGEQRRRHQADRAHRAALAREVPPLDEAFLAALEAGHPPAAGIAVGLDRLVALVLGARSAREVTGFPEEV